MGLTLLTFVVFPSSVGLSLLADDLVPLLMGVKWQGAVPLVELIVLTAPAMALVRMNSSVQYAFGRANAVAGLAILSTCILAFALLALPITTAWGAIAVLVFRYYAMLPFHFVQLRRATGLSLRRIARSLLPNLLATGIMVGAIVVCQVTFLDSSESLTRILVCVAVGVVVYTGAVVVVAPATVREARNAVVAAISRPSPDARNEGV
jgi:O-antigen/teichoic acid export membrane protein